MKLLVTVFLSRVFLLLVVSCGPDERDGITRRFAHTHHVAHPIHDPVVRFQEELAERSHGEIRLLIYPNEVLGTERECVELMQLGALDMTKMSSAVMEACQEDFKTFGLPFLFNDSTHMWEVLDGGIGKEILQSGRSRNLLGVGFFDAGARCVLNVGGGRSRGGVDAFSRESSKHLC